MPSILPGRQGLVVSQSRAWQSSLDAGLIAAGGLGGAAAVLALARRDRGRPARRARRRRRVHAGHEGSGHADFRDGRTVDHAANGFDPHELVRDFDWGRTTPHRVRARAARVGARRARPRDRGRAGRALRGLDLQRPHPGPDAALPRGRAAADHVRQRLRAPAHDPLPRHPPVRDGRRARARAPGRSSRGGKTVYEFDALPAGLHLYHCHVRPLAEHIAKGLYGAFIVDPKDGARGRRRARDGHERVRHELRPRERGLRRQHDPVRLHEPADRGPARRARPALRRQRARVRPDQLVPPAREPVRLVSDGHVAHGGGAHRHRDALPGPARDRRVAVPDRRAGSCSTRTSPSSPSSAGRASSRSR